MQIKFIRCISDVSIAIILMCSLVSCAEDHLVVEYMESGKSGTSSIYPVANVNSLVTRAGLSPLQANRVVAMYVYDSSRKFNVEKYYYTSAPGILTPTDNTVLTEPDGLYSFYCFSIGNSYTSPPSFMNGTVAGGLNNGVDYLACNVLSQQIDTSTDLPLTFSHSCAQLVLDFVSANDDQGVPEVIINSISDVTVTPPSVTGLTIDMYTGIITPSTNIDSNKTISMPVTGTMCQQIILPLNYDGSLDVKFRASTSTSTGSNDADYNSELTVAGGKYGPGKSYHYKVQFNKDNTAAIYYVNVYDWIEVDENGTPLTPVVKQ